MEFQIRTFLILIFLLKNVTDARIPFTSELSTERSLATFVECAESFMFIFKNPVMISDEAQSKEFAINLLKALGTTVSLINIDLVQPKRTKYILFSREVAFYQQLVESVSSESTPYLIILWPFSDAIVPNKTMEDMFSVFWSRRIYSFLVFMEDDRHNIHVYSHFPYRPHRCGIAGPPIHVDTWVSKDKKFTSGFFSSYSGLLKNFYGCPLRVLSKNRPPESSALVENGSVRLVGIGGKILNALMLRYNFTVTLKQAEDLEDGTYLRDKYGYVLSNHSNDKIVHALRDDMVDLAFGVFPFVTCFSPEIVLSIFTLTENFAFYVPCGTEGTPSLYRFYYVEFALPIWGLVLLSFVIFLGFMKLLSTLLSEEENSLSSFWRNTFILWAIHVENSASLRTRSTTVKAFLTMVMLYSMIISVAYRASLKSFLMAHLDPKSIETWEELEKADFNIAGLEQDFSILDTLGITHPTLQRLSRRYKARSTGEFSDIVYDLAVKRITAYFGSERMLMFYYSSLQEEHGTTIQRVCQVGQFVSSSPTSLFMVRSGSPFDYMIDQLTIKEIQTGHMKYTGAIASTSTSTSLNEKQEQFSLNHLKGTFYMWLIGTTTALIALTIEILCFKLNPDRITYF